MAWCRRKLLHHKKCHIDVPGTICSRTQYWPGYYAAFVFDPDGHNIEAVWWDYSKVKKAKKKSNSKAKKK